MSDHRATKKLIEYLKIKSVHPDPDYEGAVKFIREYAKEVGFDSYKEIEVMPKKVVCLLTYLGTSPEKESILLNSHYDVVPCDDKYWKCDPFEGKIYENGDICARGVQDMKSVGIIHVETIRRMKEANIRPERTIHLSFVPDEEIGGLTGMVPFIDTKEFKELNVGLALDEGQVSPNENYDIYYAQRMLWWVDVTFRGNAGHGSRFIEKTAAEKLQRVLNKLLGYREEQKQKLKANCNCMTLGDVNSINLTKLGGGLAQNLVPAEFTATFDFRLTTSTDVFEFEKMLAKWFEEAEEGETDSGRITYEFNCKKSDHTVTSIDENKNPWWKCLKGSLNEMGFNVKPQVFPAGTDTRYLREIGINGFGFTPFNNTPILLHDHNEFLNVNTFLKGLDIMYKVVVDLGNMK